MLPCLPCLPCLPAALRPSVPSVLFCTPRPRTPLPALALRATFPKQTQANVNACCRCHWRSDCHSVTLSLTVTVTITDCFTITVTVPLPSVSPHLHHCPLASPRARRVHIASASPSSRLAANLRLLTPAVSTSHTVKCQDHFVAASRVITEHHGDSRSTRAGA